MSFFDSTQIGIITNPMAKDVDEIDNFLTSSAENSIRNFCRVFEEIIFRREHSFRTQCCVRVYFSIKLEAAALQYN